MSEELMKKLVENNLDYAELLLIPANSGLGLVNKDMGLGNIDDQEYFKIKNECYSFDNYGDGFKKIVEAIIKLTKDADGNLNSELINEKLYPKEIIDKGLKSGELKRVNIEIPRYSKTYLCLKSMVVTPLVLSGSKGGFRALLQHSTIQRTKQEQTLEDLTSIKKNKKRGNNNGNTN